MTRDSSFQFIFSVQDARRLLLYLVLVELALVAAYVLIHILLSQYWWGPLGQLSDLGHDHSVPSWFAAVQLFAAGMVLFPISRLEPDHKWFIRLGALVLLFLSVDEGASIHEKVTGFAKVQDVAVLQAFMIENHGAWIIPYLIAGVVLLAINIKPIVAIFRKHRVASLLVIAGAVTVVSGAMGLEVLSYLYLRDGADQLLRAEVAAEEFLEMLGVSLVLYGILIYGIGLQHQSGRSASVTSGARRSAAGPSVAAADPDSAGLTPKRRLLFSSLFFRS